MDIVDIFDYFILP